MKMNIFSRTLAWLLPVAVLSSCQPEEFSLEGNASQANFTFTVTPASLPDTLPFQSTVRFTNTSQDAFIFRWSFGDNSQRSLERDPVHVYRVGGTYSVTLTSVGTAGNNSITRQVTVPDPCSNAAFEALTGCGNKQWVFSAASDAIRVLSADASEVFFAGPAAGCQGDDVYTFSVSGALSYDAKGSTFVANEGPAPYSCQVAQPNATSFRMIARAGQRPAILLSTAGLNRNPFLGTTDPVQGNLYEIMNFTDETLTLRGRLLDGALIEVKFQVGTSIGAVKQLLTGGSSKNWRLDPTPGANTIIVGTEGNPAEFFGGGALAECQETDVYTFTSDDRVIYNANGSTFIAPGFFCGEDRSFSAPYQFGGVTGGAAGQAQISLGNNNLFIGITDRAPENIYRIMEINQNVMILRAGNGSGVVHTMRFIAVP